MSFSGLKTAVVNIAHNAEQKGEEIDKASLAASFAAAVSVGARDFVAIAVCGGKEGEDPDPACTPCGVCRQVMAEFCKPDFEVILNGRTLTLAELLPHSFGM